MSTHFDGNPFVLYLCKSKMFTPFHINKKKTHYRLPSVLFVILPKILQGRIVTSLEMAITFLCTIIIRHYKHHNTRNSPYIFMLLIFKEVTQFQFQDLCKTFFYINTFWVSFVHLRVKLLLNYLLQCMYHCVPPICSISFWT